MQIAASLRPFWRSLLIAIANLLALLIYAVGLIAPLTPSEGTPSLLEIVIFVGIPTAILGWCIHACSSRPAALLLGLQLFAVLGFFTHLLLMQSGALNG